VFILTGDQILELPVAEQRYFRPAIFRDAITNGTIRRKFFVFFPYNKMGLIFSSESADQVRLPVYFNRFLLPYRKELSTRSGISAELKPWWSLSRYYAWSQRTEPRILTKYFGSFGVFALDLLAEFVPLQGYAWFLKQGSIRTRSAKDPSEQLLKAYLSLLNSRAFSRLLKIFSDPVAGGQFNLSARFVRPIPLPDLGRPENVDLATDLARLADAPDFLSPSWLRVNDELAPSAWGTDLVSALTEMDNA